MESPKPHLERLLRTSNGEVEGTRGRPGRYDSPRMSRPPSPAPTPDSPAQPPEPSGAVGNRSDTGSTGVSLAASSGDRRAVLGIALAAFLAALALGAWTIDFGRHWDEVLFVEQVARTVESGVPLPRNSVGPDLYESRYAYPCVTYWVALAAVLPTAAAHGFDRAAIVAELREFVSARDGPLAFLLHARLLAYALSYLALFWIAWLALELTRSRFAALIATLFFALSFEVHYHARWLAPDALLAQFTIGATLFALLWYRSGRRRDFLLATLLAALAAGSKYPGAIAMLPLGLAIALRPGLPLGSRLGRWLGAALLFAGGFLLTTPGALLESELFVKWIEKELLHYSRGHLVYTVAPGAEHAGLLLTYLATQTLHAFDLLAVLAFALAALGALRLLARDPHEGLILFCLPWLLVLYFAQQQVMLVRNVLAVTPFLCLFAGVGLAALGQRSPRAARALAALLLISQAAWLVHADRTLAQRVRPSDASALHASQVAAVERFAEDHEPPIFATHDLSPLDSSAGFSDLDAAGTVIFDPRRARVRRPWNSMANRPGVYRIVGGPLDVNWDYYPTWSGDPRPIAVDADYYVSVFAPPRRADH